MHERLLATFAFVDGVGFGWRADFGAGGYNRDTAGAFSIVTRNILGPSPWVAYCALGCPFSGGSLRCWWKRLFGCRLFDAIQLDACTFGLTSTVRRFPFFIGLLNGWRNPFKPNARGAYSPVRLGIDIPFSAFSIPSLYFALFLLDEESPPSSKSVASLREHIFNDQINVDTRTSHPLECILLQLRRERWWLL